jgi:hypothetical protein
MYRRAVTNQQNLIEFGKMITAKNETTVTRFLLARLVRLYFAVLKFQGLGQEVTSQNFK